MHHTTHSNVFSRAAWTLAATLIAGASAVAQTGNIATVPDAQIEANVLKSLAASSQLATENIVTNTVYGTVTLSGSVKDESTRRLAETLASRADGVKKVVDELTLGAPNAAGTSDANATAPQPSDSLNGSNPMLQSDGTMASQQQPQPPQQGQPQHAPDPDVYAAQHPQSDPQANPQANPQADPQANPQYNAADPNAQPASRQPYSNTPLPGNPGYAQQQPYPTQPQQPYGQQPYPQQQPYGQQPYPQRPYQDQQQRTPPPYGAQVAGQPVTVPQGSLLRVRINEGLDSKHSQPGTPFDAVVLNDVVADGAVAIPRGASVQGTVVDARSGGVLKGHGELALQLHQVTLGGKAYPLSSDIWSRDSSDKSGQTIGSAIGLGATGAIIGAIAGGGPGAAIGAGVGGLAGVGASAASGSRQVLVPSEAILTFHLTQPAPMATISQAEMDRLSYGVPTGAQQQMRRRYPPAPYYGPVYYPRPYPAPYPYPY